MKIILACLAAAGVGFGAAYLYVSNEQTTAFQKEKSALESQWTESKDKLERELREAKNRAGRVEQVTETVEVVKTVQKTPKEILDKLVQIKPAAGNARYASIREIIHHLESLAEIGPGALPTIRTFLKQNVDVSYERERERPQNADGTPQTAGGPGGQGGPGGGDRGGFGGGPPPWAGGGGNELPRTEDYYPYSLRIGLYDVVKKIGGGEAETILAESLQTTGRGVEVAHLTQLLEEIAPNKYAALAISAAKDLLANPLTIENPTRLDEQSKTFLYAILRKYNDLTFVPTAQQLVIQADGRLDRNALGYLTSALKEQSVSALYSMYHDARVTNNFDKAAIATSALNYVGMSTTSDQMFRDIMNNEEAGMMRFLALGRLNDGTLTPEVIQSRIQLVQSLKFEDERMQGMVQRTIQSLQNKANPQAGGDNNDNRRRGFETFFGGGGNRGPGGPRN
jgi:hypothetical protein